MQVGDARRIANLRQELLRRALTLIKVSLTALHHGFHITVP